MINSFWVLKKIAPAHKMSKELAEVPQEALKTLASHLLPTNPTYESYLSFHIRPPTAQVGICYECSCPSFLHYHVCKHVLAYALHTKEAKMPLTFNPEAVGKRKAPAGARPAKRSHCLLVDA